MSQPLRYDMPGSATPPGTPGGCLLCYDAGQNADDALMLSGPHTGAGGSSPPGSWPNPGDSDKWDGPYGPPITDWTNVSHPGADMTQGGWVPPNAALKYDSSIPAGWYTRITKRALTLDKPTVVVVNDP